MFARLAEAEAKAHGRPVSQTHLGSPIRTADTTASRDEVLVEANIDDLTPDLYDHAFERLFEAGAVDVFVTPVMMKKGRPAHTLSVLVERSKLEPVLAALFRETTTIGCRVIGFEKRVRPRVSTEVSTPWGVVPLELSLLGDQVVSRRPELDACRRLARAAEVPLRVVVEAATAAAAKLDAPPRGRRPRGAGEQVRPARTRSELSTR